MIHIKFAIINYIYYIFLMQFLIVGMTNKRREMLLMTSKKKVYLHLQWRKN